MPALLHSVRQNLPQDLGPSVVVLVVGLGRLAAVVVARLVPTPTRNLPEEGFLGRRTPTQGTCLAQQADCLGISQLERLRLVHQVCISSIKSLPSAHHWMQEQILKLGSMMVFLPLRLVHRIPHIRSSLRRMA